MYNVLGGGIREKIIQRAFVNELESLGFDVEKEVGIEILCKGEKVGTYIPDVVVNNKIIIEIKSKPFLIIEDKKQFWGYLKGSNYKLGFLIGFTPQKLEIGRFVHTKNPYKSVKSV